MTTSDSQEGVCGRMFPCCVMMAPSAWCRFNKFQFVLLTTKLLGQKRRYIEENFPSHCSLEMCERLQKKSKIGWWEKIWKNIPMPPWECQQKYGTLNCFSNCLKRMLHTQSLSRKQSENVSELASIPSTYFLLLSRSIMPSHAFACLPSKRNLESDKI